MDNVNIDMQLIEKLISPEILDKLKDEIRRKVTEEIENDGKIYCKKVRDYIYKSRDKNKDKYNQYMREYKRKKREELQASGELDKIKEQQLAKQIETLNKKLNDMKVKNSEQEAK
jgi:hypothetical protein